MIWLETILVAVSMFSAIPVPQVAWNERNMRYALCAFPLVGVLAGICMGLWNLLAGALVLPDILRGAGLCLIPVAVTGGIHLDGFADTHDALSSQQGPEKRREIQKDPHIGTFAVIRLTGYMILSFALWCALKRYPWLLWALALCLSRSLSGLAVASFPLASGSGLAYTFSAAADKHRVSVFLTVLSILLMIGMCLIGPAGAVMSLAAAVVFLFYRRMAVKKFGGLSGDLAGWFLQTAEIWMLAVLCGMQYLEAVL